jgi:hypothetical protein
VNRFVDLVEEPLRCFGLWQDDAAVHREFGDHGQGAHDIIGSGVAMDALGQPVEGAVLRPRRVRAADERDVGHHGADPFVNGADNQRVPPAEARAP